MSDGGWTPERIALLRKLWGEGLSGAQIAKQLGGVTRNAVIGKVHRVGLTGRVSPARPVKRIPRQRPAVTVKRVSRQMVAPMAKAPPIAEEELEPLRDATGQPIAPDVLALKACQCRYPIGDPRVAGFAFCARPTMPNERGVPYCEAHRRNSLQKYQRGSRAA